MATADRFANNALPRKPFVAILAVAIASCANSALCDDCGLLGGAIAGGECQVASAQTKSGAFNLAEPLHVLGNGSITVPAAAGGNSLTLNIEGDFVMDLPTITNGSRITGDVTTANGIAATITVTTTGGSIILHGNATTGARISSSQSAGSCSGGRAGNVYLTAEDRDITVGDGAAVATTAICPAGEIRLLAANADIEIEGDLQSESTLSGTGANQRPGGGPITLTAGCNLTVGDSGTVSSKGRDPGADLVHLQGGCSVKIFGFVESTGTGHGTPNNPPNHCNSTNRPDKLSNATACVEVWAGDSLIIDRTIPHAGEVNGDTGGQGGSSGTSWVDLFSRGDIVVTGRTSGVYAVHANGNAGTNDNGGIVTARTRDGKITTAGFALQTNATGSGGKGGTLKLEAGGPVGSGDVSLGTASLQAKGATSGGAPAGGNISARAFNGSVLGASGGELVATGGLSGGNGVINLQGCNAPGPAVSYLGTSTPSATILQPACGGTPAFAGYVALPDCICGCFCLTGIKFVGGVLSLKGHTLREVAQLEFHTSCETGQGVVVPKTSFLTQTDTNITLNPPSGSSGERVILVNPVIGSSACSTQVVP